MVTSYRSVSGSSRRTEQHRVTDVRRHLENAILEFSSVAMRTGRRNVDIAVSLLHLGDRFVSKEHSRFQSRQPDLSINRPDRRGSRIQNRHQDSIWSRLSCRGADNSLGKFVVQRNIRPGNESFREETRRMFQWLKGNAVPL